MAKKAPALPAVDPAITETADARREALKVLEKKMQESASAKAMKRLIFASGRLIELAQRRDAELASSQEQIDRLSRLLFKDGDGAAGAARVNGSPVDQVAAETN